MSKQSRARPVRNKYETRQAQTQVDNPRLSPYVSYETVRLSWTSVAPNSALTQQGLLVRSQYHPPYRNHSGVPNLSRKRQHPALVALGKAIREVRQSKGITQGRLALIAELDRSYVGRVERGDNNAAVLTLSRLAAALDISVAKLMQKAGL